jgi:hypothetical protein
VKGKPTRILEMIYDHIVNTKIGMQSVVTHGHADTDSFLKQPVGKGKTLMRAP